MNWDLFIGPAPMRPFHEIYTPWNWRGWWDFGTGALGDMACHILNPVFNALKLEVPHQGPGFFHTGQYRIGTPGRGGGIYLPGKRESCPEA